MFSDDPVGEYEIAVFLDKKLAADFKFRVIKEANGIATEMPPNTTLEPTPTAP